MKKGLLIIISGPSGVGKGTVRSLVMQMTDLNLAYSVSWTTRSERPGEKDGVDYHFISEEEFQKAVANGEFLEHTSFVRHNYGTPKAAVEKLRNEGKNVLLEIEVKGAQQVIEKCWGEKIVTIFILPPSFEELEKRIRGRSTETEEELQKRLEKAEKEMGMASLYRHHVINDSLTRAAEEIRSIIKDEILNR